MVIKGPGSPGESVSVVGHHWSEAQIGAHQEVQCRERHQGPRPHWVWPGHRGGKGSSSPHLIGTVAQQGGAWLVVQSLLSDAWSTRQLKITFLCSKPPGTHHQDVPANRTTAHQTTTLHFTWPHQPHHALQFNLPSRQTVQWHMCQDHSALARPVNARI